MSSRLFPLSAINRLHGNGELGYSIKAELFFPAPCPALPGAAAAPPVRLDAGNDATFCPVWFPPAPCPGFPPHPATARITVEIATACRNHAFNVILLSRVTWALVHSTSIESVNRHYPDRALRRTSFVFTACQNQMVLHTRIAHICKRCRQCTERLNLASVYVDP